MLGSGWNEIPTARSPFRGSEAGCGGGGWLGPACYCGCLWCKSCGRTCAYPAPTLWGLACPPHPLDASTHPPGLLLETSFSPASSHQSPKLTAPNWAPLYSAADGMSSLLKARTEAWALQGARPGGCGDKGNEDSASLALTLSAARGGGLVTFLPFFD